MSAIRRAGIICLLLGVVTFLVSAATAGTIEAFAPAPVASGPGLGTVLVPPFFTLAPDNDEVPGPGGADNNIFVPIKRFDNNGHIDIEFFVSPSNGVTEYQVFESVDNNTGVPWSSYRMELGYKNALGQFVPSTPGDGLDFDFPEYNTPALSTVMPIISRPNEDTIVFSGGLHGNGAESYRFRIDVPNVPTADFFSRFTIRQTPIPVPEPSTVVLLGVALAGVMAYRSRG